MTVQNSPQKNRWLIVVGALMVQFCLGAIYAWGAFTEALIDPEGFFQFSGTQTQTIFAVGLLTFALVGVLAGRLQDKHGPRPIAFIGGLLVGIGYILAGLSGSSFPLLLLGIGVIGGAGIGMGYVCPIAACVKWFPDKKGLITGMAVAGFGAGASVFIKIAGSWFNLIENFGVNTTFLVFGAIFLIFVCTGSLLLTNPPKGYKPPNYNPELAAEAALTPPIDMTQSQTIRTPHFWMIWLCFILSAGCGLMLIGSLVDYGVLERDLTLAAAGSALGLLAICNGVGRIIWGSISQKLSAEKGVALMTVMQTMAIFFLLGWGSSAFALTIAACWIGFNFGGNFILYPLLTHDSFGQKNFGANYGIVYTAYGVGGLVGPILAGRVYDTMGTFKTAFIAGAVACAFTAAISLLIPKVRSLHMKGQAQVRQAEEKSRVDDNLPCQAEQTEL